MIQHFFIEGVSYASVERHHIIRSSTVIPPFGYAFFCPDCTRLWAIAPVEGEKSQAVKSACSKHVGDFPSLYPSGSIWLDWDDDFVSALPPDVLKREFDLHLTFLNRNLRRQKHEQEEATSCSTA